MLVRFLRHNMIGSAGRTSDQAQTDRRFTNDVDMPGKTLHLGSRQRARVPTVSFLLRLQVLQARG